LEQIRLKYIN